MLRTPLYHAHVGLGARMIPFGGWEMPVQYTSIMEEHVAVRKAAGIFDVSHMGDIIVRGQGAKELLNRLFTNDLSALPVGKAIYAHYLDDQGHIIDDTIAYHWLEGEYLLVPNAATTAKVLQWIRAHATTQEVIDRSDRLACIALQGPKAQDILEQLSFEDLGGMKHNSAQFTEIFAEGKTVSGLIEGFRPTGLLCDTIASQCRPGTKGTRGEFRESVYLCRTGYTGEDGFEIIIENPSAEVLWNILLRAGKEQGLVPAGLGARDTLRLEMGFLLSGTDFDGGQSSLQTGPPWVVKFDHDFIGKQALLQQREAGDYDRLVCLELAEKGIPRHGYPLASGGEAIGTVTSGTMSPCLKRGIALGYVRPPFHDLGTELDVMIRGSSVKAKVVRPPFYKKGGGMDAKKV
jgi:aminomethyltransferase